MNYFLILSVFLAVVFATTGTNIPDAAPATTTTTTPASAAPATPFAELAPNDATHLEEFNKTVAVVTEKKEAIIACKYEPNFEAFKGCIGKIENMPKLFVDNFPKMYTEEKSVDEAMKAYVAALVKPATDVKLAESKEEATLLDKAADIMFYVMYIAVGIFVIAGFIMIVYAYFVKKNEGSDL